jgi:putative endopeptidase
MKLSRLSMLAVMAVLTVLAIGTTLAQTNEHGLDRRNMDTTVSPCDNFWLYSNATWLKNNPIPAAYTTWSVWDEINERNRTLLHDLVEEAAKSNSPKGTSDQKIGDFFYTAMDTVSIEKAGAAPLKKDFDKIAAISSVDQLGQMIVSYHAKGYGMVFNGYAQEDLKNSSQVIFYADQSGLSLPDRDYYTRTDSESQVLRQQFLQHVTAMFKLIGDDDATAGREAKAVMEIETKLAEASLTNVVLRDPDSSYNMVSVAKADSATPNFSWKRYFSGLGLERVTTFSYSHPRFFEEMNRLLKEAGLDAWKSYLRWHVAAAAAPYLSSAFVNEDFKFDDSILSGAKELLPRWKRALRSVNGALGEELGKLYVAKAFPPRSKDRAMEMIKNLQIALGKRIEALPWMSDVTKKQALHKLSTFTPKIGYPDKWRDYSKLEISRDSYIENVRRGREFAEQFDLNKVGKPVDKTEWGMTPQTLNAYYNPLQNEIVFPAAILQPPFFDADVDDPINYGAMGAVIGHEMTHGFDDQGCRFDAEGNMKNWWTPGDSSEFAHRTEKLVDQYDKYKVVDTVNHVNGKLTVGENIADLGGLLVAYDALQVALAGKPKTLIDGFTPEQRFFLSFGQAWRENDRDEYLKLLVNSDPHSPAMYRVLGTLRNHPGFAKAFGCEAGKPMVNTDSTIVRIW